MDMATASPDLSSITLAARELFERDLELIPIPTVQVVRDGDGFDFLAVNRAYRLAGLGVIADRSPMLALLGSRGTRTTTSTTGPGTTCATPSTPRSCGPSWAGHPATPTSRPV